MQPRRPTRAGAAGSPRRHPLRPARRPRRAAGAAAGRHAPDRKASRTRSSRFVSAGRRARHRGGASAGLRRLHPGPARPAAHRARVGDASDPAADLPLPHEVLEHDDLGLTAEPFAPLPEPDDGARRPTPVRPSRSRAPGRWTTWPVAGCPERGRRDGAGPDAGRGRGSRRGDDRATDGRGRSAGDVDRAAARRRGGRSRDHLAGRAREIELLLRERRSRSRPRDVEVIVPRHLSASKVVALARDRDGVRPPAAPTHAGAAGRGRPAGHRVPRLGRAALRPGRHGRPARPARQRRRATRATTATCR